MEQACKHRQRSPGPSPALPSAWRSTPEPFHSQPWRLQLPSQQYPDPASTCLVESCYVSLTRPSYASHSGDMPLVHKLRLQCLVNGLQHPVLKYDQECADRQSRKSLIEGLKWSHTTYTTAKRDFLFQNTSTACTVAARAASRDSCSWAARMSAASLSAVCVLVASCSAAWRCPSTAAASALILLSSCQSKGAQSVHTTSAVYAETRRPKAVCTTFKCSMQASISQGAAATVTECTVSCCDPAQHVQSCRHTVWSTQSTQSPC